MGVKGCWTCRSRKVRCDGSKPTCGNCVKSKRVCHGYGVQLSWPREGDKRRAVVAQNAGRPTRHERQWAKFLNVCPWDVVLAQGLEDQVDIATHFGTMAASPWHSLRPFRMSPGNSHLFDFFMESRAMLLAPIVNLPLTDYILRIAFSDSSPDTNLVFHAILTIASLKFQGHSHAMYHKSRVISMLRESLTLLDRPSIIRNLIATMVLYQYELSHTMASSHDWAPHLCGAKRIIDVGSKTNVLRQDEDHLLLDWVYYHEVSSEFTLRHWMVPKELARVCQKEPRAQPPRIASSTALISERSSRFNDALYLFALICRCTASDIYHVQSEQEKQDMARVEAFVANVHSSIGEDGPAYDSSGVVVRRELIVLLHQITSLIYYNRSVASAAETFQHRRLVREGLLLLKALGSCESALPLFLLACEASDDDQRLDILDVFDRTESDDKQRSNHIATVRKMTTAVWNQKDLNVGNQVSHGEILDAVISTSGFLPLIA